MEKTSPKDVFLHILSILTLYITAGSFVALLFQYVNVFFLDPLHGYYELRGAYSAIRWAIAALIIIYPVHLWTMWVLYKSYAATPLKRNLKIRKWLIYFTLFAAGLILMGDGVALIYNLLGGELTVRFLLKVLSVLVVGGTIFGYYLWDIKKYKTE